MKFAREFKETLEKEGFPARWVELAVPYGQLKKCLKKVCRGQSGNYIYLGWLRGCGSQLYKISMNSLQYRFS